MASSLMAGEAGNGTPIDPYAASLCQSGYDLADFNMGGQAYNGGPAYYNKDEWNRGCESVAPGAGRQTNESASCIK